MTINMNTDEALKVATKHDGCNGRTVLKRQNTEDSDNVRGKVGKRLEYAPTKAWELHSHVQTGRLPA